MTEPRERPRYVNGRPKTLLASMVLGMIGQTLVGPKPKRMRESVKSIAPKMSGRIVGMASAVARIDKSDNDDSFRQRMKSERLRRKRFKTKL